MMKRKDGECTKTCARDPVFISVEVGRSAEKQREVRAGGRLARSGNAKLNRADAMPQWATLNLSGAGPPKGEARLP